MRIRSTCVAGLAVVVGMCCVAMAADSPPVITAIGFSRPSSAQPNQPLLIMGRRYATDAVVRFSDGAGGTVTATPVFVDLGRGVLGVIVPGTARTGTVVVHANGLDSDPYSLIVSGAGYSTGTDVVSGHVTRASDGTDLPGALVALLRATGCDNQVMWDLAVTDVTGHYTLHGQDGPHAVIVWPPSGNHIAAAIGSTTLGATPATFDVALSAGTLVTGTVTDNSAVPAGIGGVRVEFEGNAMDMTVTDNTGQFALALTPGDWRMTATAPSHAPGGKTNFSFVRQGVTVDGTGSQALPAVRLQTGMLITGRVTRARDGLALSGVVVSAHAQDSGSGNTEDADRKLTVGDGQFALVVAPGQGYQVSMNLDDDSGLADGFASVQVAMADVTQDFSLPDAGVIKGRTTRRSNGAAASDLNVSAQQGQNSFAYARTCADGTYALRVPPSVTGYTVQVQDNAGAYATTFWSSQGQTYFSCEATPIQVLTSATVVSGINVAVSGATSISGTVRSQLSGCAAGFPGVFVQVDDGTQHACTIGNGPPSDGNGHYTVSGLPPSSEFGALRACIHDPSSAPQCYSMQRPPSFTPVVAAAGVPATGIDFCAGAQPTTAVSNLRVRRVGANVELSWDPVSDLFATQYTLRGGSSATPGSKPGNFPYDPAMSILMRAPLTSTTIPATSPNVFFLVTATGATGEDGPSGSYGH